MNKSLDIFRLFNYEGFLMTKMFYDHIGKQFNIRLYDYEDEDLNYNLLDNMMYYIFDRVYIDFDDYGSMLLEITDPAITKFYHLCKEYSRRKHSAFQKNPYVEEFKKSIEHFEYDGDLTPIDRDCRMTLFFEQEQFYDYISILDCLLFIKEFLEQKNEELNSILCPTVGQSMPAPERNVA